SAPGDIIFTSEFSSSAISLVEARIWIHRSMRSITPASFNWGGQFDGDGTGAMYGYANIVPKTAGNFYTGLQTTLPATWAGPFKVVRDNDAVVNNYIPGQYLEFAVNLSKLGIEPTNYNQDACDPAFIRVIVKTRSSTSFTAELKDFVAPFKFFDYPPVEAYSYVTYYCGAMSEVQISVLNPNPNFTYIWTTNNGNIVGSNIGSIITINAPGTYYVQQKSNTNCVVSSIDSITILHDPVCVVLDVNITNLQAAVTGDYHTIKWKASNNQEVDKYELEYSINNKTFLTLGNVGAGNISGEANFEIQHLSNLIASDVIFYRVKAIGKNGSFKYSNVIALRKTDGVIKEALIYPNPSNGLLWLSYLSGKKEIADVHIFDNYGKLIVSTKLSLNMGENLIKIPELYGKAQGTYLIKIKTSGGDINQKILLLK
ncbi:MAG TPA: T9SS type A sorting domain-containing protein, partial [Ferruginibacter sp.]|nr:T9SS type A sorting domain-containing protein [Ferruginibacter sp.]